MIKLSIKIDIAVRASGSILWSRRQEVASFFESSSFFSALVGGVDTFSVLFSINEYLKHNIRSTKKEKVVKLFIWASGFSSLLVATLASNADKR